MDNKKAYIKVDVSHELPEEVGQYFTNSGLLQYGVCLTDTSDIVFKKFDLFEQKDIEVKIKWWLKEIDLTELIMEFWKQIYEEDNIPNIEDLNIFLTSKGIQL